MAAPNFRFVCVPAALDGVPPEWADLLLEDGELALLVDGGGIAAIDAVAHALGLVSLSLVRTEADAEAQERTVMEHAAALPLVWVAPTFGERARTWAKDRGPMTLLVESAGPLGEDERRRIARFIGSLGRQAE